MKKLKFEKLAKKLSEVTIASDEISQLELDKIIDIDMLFLDSNYTTSPGYQQSLIIPPFLLDFFCAPLDLLLPNHSIWQSKSPNLISRIVITIIVSGIWFSFLHFLFKQLTNFETVTLKKQKQDCSLKRFIHSEGRIELSGVSPQFSTNYILHKG